MTIEDMHVGYNKPSIYMECKNRELSLLEINEMILAGDEICVNNLLRTIRKTMTAKQTRLHVQAVKKLHGKCIILGGLLFGKHFDQKERIEHAFSELADYAQVGIFPQLH